MKYYIGIDLGGTNIAAGVVDESCKIIARASTPTKRPRSCADISEDMARVAREAASAAGISLEDVEYIGVGAPGTVNSETGRIEYSNNLDFYDEPLAEYIESKTGRRVYIENDANAAALGEFIAGAAKGRSSAVCITLGTGVGGGIIIDGKIYSGFNFAGAEIGHMVIEVDGAPCTCGRRGCFEAYSSATGLIRMTKEAMDADPGSKMHEMMGDHVSGRLAFNAMRAGDKSAKAVVDKYIKYLAAGISNVINIFQPEVLCIGGGVCNEGDALMIPLREAVREQVYSKRSQRNTEILRASLGNDAGIIGAAVLGLQRGSEASL